MDLPAPPIVAVYETCHLLRGTLSEQISKYYTTTGSSSLHSSDTLRFGYLWSVVQPHVLEGTLHELIAARRREISARKEYWRARIGELRQENGDLYQKIEHCFSQGKLIGLAEGSGAAYLLVDDQEKSRFIVKPIDEDIFCLNNRKQYASPFNEERYRVRAPIPLYRSHQTDVLAYRVATLVGFSHLTPPTVMGIYSSSNFYDITDLAHEEQRREFYKLSGEPDREKLCSIQEYFSHAQDLKGLSQAWYQEDLSDSTILKSVDQKNFEEMNLFVWLLYDNDAHGGNILTYVKGIDSEGKPLYALKKIDNGLTFPERNAHLVNLLSTLPNALLPLSGEGREWIAKIPVEKIAHEMRTWELEDCIPALLERVQILQELAQRPEISIKEINLRLSALELPDGRLLALSDLTYDELQDEMNTSVTQCLPILD
jgi:hypothetical protein